MTNPSPHELLGLLPPISESFVVPLPYAAVAAPATASGRHGWWWAQVEIPFAEQGFNLPHDDLRIVQTSHRNGKGIEKLVHGRHHRTRISVLPGTKKPSWWVPCDVFGSTLSARTCNSARRDTATPPPVTVLCRSAILWFCAHQLQQTLATFTLRCVSPRRHFAMAYLTKPKHTPSQNPPITRKFSS